ncbi:MAG: alpha/beta fold hydrolase [Acidothermaceae bacterium]
MPLPIVLLHAFPVSSRMWEPLRAALPADVELLTPDFRGAGEVPLDDDPPSLDLLADDVARFLDLSGIDRAIIGGLSMGGYTTMAFMRRHPERVAAIVLADTKADADVENARANRLAMAETLDTEGTSRVLTKDVLPTLVGETTKRERPSAMAFVSDLVASARSASAAWWQRSMAARPDSFDTLRHIAVPALVIVGSEDGLATVAQARAMAAALPVAELVELPQAGHFSAVETPDAFAAALAGFTSAG